MERIQLADDRIYCRAFMSKVINCLVPLNAENFFSSWTIYLTKKKDLIANDSIMLKRVLKLIG